jgi:2-polyprenyl-3-methyl-5-hydroxy-6-metoxy-1,4-benzoquinol methylase
MAYDRVADIFENVDLNNKSLVMVGCGQLPVTAIHLIEESAIKHVTALDVSEQAIKVVTRLKEKFKWEKLDAQYCNGSEYDYNDADIIYIANMVRPKSAVINQVLKTARPDAEIIVREPYALGKLWADCAQSSLDSRLKIASFGPGSRYLSRDAFMQRV